ncbi:MAG: 1-acyl-sn-glycerol-3-phosphate acyltransferase [Dysgonamonadaceae bacterium]|jgi:hypothetical protein|nr:1-acyl-sn-glycerol-3-phosphate acyltransferase [Dysgonamonadaceae bacterium]
MATTNEFDDIRPRLDEEVPATIERLLQDIEFQKVIARLFPGRKKEEMEGWVRSFRTKRDFQHQLVKDLVYSVVGKASDSIDSAGYENIRKDTAYTYISNHRDIVLDAALICVMLITAGYDTVEIAIGDNLLARPWIEDLVRLNKSFIVKRGVGIREMLEVSNHLSKYIHYTIKEKNESVWIAQREGRAKDSDDHTQESVVKMLAMGGGKDFLASIRELNIVPVSLSYEYDPCDFLKAKEFQQKRDNPDFKKTKEDDLLNMQTGIFGYKGRIHFQFGCSIASELDKLDASTPKTELAQAIAAIIDREIYRNYHFYPVNYWAYDQLENSRRFVGKYTLADVGKIENYFSKQLDKIDLPDKDIPFLTQKMMEMYANPVRNQLKL